MKEERRTRIKKYDEETKKKRRKGSKGGYTYSEVYILHMTTQREKKGTRYLSLTIQKNIKTISTVFRSNSSCKFWAFSERSTHFKVCFEPPKGHLSKQRLHQHEQVIQQATDPTSTNQFTI